MCVIALVTKVRPKPEAVEKMFFSNDHGGGLAWREKDEKTGLTIVRWKKGLEEKEMQELIAELPIPFVAHFRIASCGAKSKELCHPFPIGKEATLALEGTTKGYVLFHNGHWTEWKTFTKETALKMGKPIPMGQWSDTRAMAWAAHNYGLGILEFIDEKVVAFGPNDLEVMRGSGWDEVDGIWCSNKTWSYGAGGRHKGNSQANQFFGRPDPQQGGKGDTYYTTPPKSMAGGDASKKRDEVPGGDFSRLPFAEVEAIWQAQRSKPRHEWQMSKKQYKRLKKAHESREWKRTKKSQKHLAHGPKAPEIPQTIH